MAPTTVLITGTTRGIGHGLLSLYLSRPDHVVIAANRDPNNAASQALLSLPRAKGTSLILVKIEATSPTDPAEAVKTLESEHGIRSLDIVIANAGIAYVYPKVSEVKVEDVEKHTRVNVHGFIWLYQGLLPLLKKGERKLWVTIGSCAAFLTVGLVFCLPRWIENDTREGRTLTFLLHEMIPMQNAAYAPTKLMGHWLTKAIHIEEPELTAFPIDPGWVQTDLGNFGAAAFGMEKAAINVEQSANGLIKVFDAATRDTHGGRMWSWEGNEVPW